MFEAQNLIKEKEVLALQEEIQKAVLAAEAILKAQVAEKEVALKKALEEVESFKAEKQEVIAKARKEKLVGVMAKEEAEELYKSLADVSDIAFEAVFKSLEKSHQVEKESDLFKEKGIRGEGKAVEQEEAGLNLVAQLIEKQKAKKQ